jgi:hypothetical protein
MTQKTAKTHKIKPPYIMETKKQTTYYLVGEDAPTLADIEEQYKMALADLRAYPTQEYINIDNQYCQMVSTGVMYKIQPQKTVTTPNFIIQTDSLIEVTHKVVAHTCAIAKQKITIETIPEFQLQFIIEIEKETHAVTAYYFEVIGAAE